MLQEPTSFSIMAPLHSNRGQPEQMGMYRAGQVVISLEVASVAVLAADVLMPTCHKKASVQPQTRV